MLGLNWKLSFIALLAIYAVATAAPPVVTVQADGCPVTVAKESIFADVTITAWKIVQQGKRTLIKLDVDIRALHGGPALPKQLKVSLTAYYNPSGCDLAGFQEYAKVQSIEKSNGVKADVRFEVPTAPGATGNGAYMFKVEVYDAKGGVLLGLHIVDPREGMPQWG